MATNNNNISIFTQIGKFSGKRGADLASWLRSFERCCVIAGKSEDLVKGQLLTLCLCGQALAVVDRFEEEQKTAQNFTAIKAKLVSVFNSDADREIMQEEFDRRHLEIDESEDEFMSSLVKLHRAANPDAADADLTRNVKRKFLNGINSDLKKNIFIFCNKPHDATVSIDSLLEAARRARLHIVEQKDQEETINAVFDATQENAVLKAIEDVKTTLTTHIQSTSQQFQEQGAQINAISDYNNSSNDRTPNSNQQRNRGSRRRGNNRRNNNGSGRGIRNDRGEVVCFKCNQPNHLAQHCMASLN